MEIITRVFLLFAAKSRNLPDPKLIPVIELSNMSSALTRAEPDSEKEMFSVEKLSQAGNRKSIIV